MRSFRRTIIEYLLLRFAMKCHVWLIPFYIVITGQYKQLVLNGVWFQTHPVCVQLGETLCPVSELDDR